jgi:hypothetical protein
LSAADAKVAISIAHSSNEVFVFTFAPHAFLNMCS